MVNGCIFDLDGTLADSLQDLADSTNYALQKQGFLPHATEEYRYFVGNGVGRLIELALPAGENTPERMAATRALFDEYYNLHYKDNTRPYKGIPELLGELKKRGFRLAVVSNKPDAFVKKLVSELFGSAFDAAVGQRDGFPRKPDPAAVNAVCAELNLCKKDCFYLGDSGVDMQTASRAGIFAVGVLWGFRTREELLKNGAQALIGRPEELIALIRPEIN